MAADAFIKVFLADDHALFRYGVRSVLQSLKNEGLFFMGEAPNGSALLEALAFQQPHVVLMDVEMPVLNGIETTTLLKQHHPDVRTIALSFSDQINYVLAMVEAGADGYLLKDTTAAELAHAIKTVHAGYSYYTPAISPIIAAKLREAKMGTLKKTTLTRRETEILTLICQGKSSKEIACSLFVSKRTIDSFREKIKQKTGMKNVLQLMRYALKEALIRM